MYDKAKVNTLLDNVIRYQQVGVNSIDVKFCSINDNVWNGFMKALSYIRFIKLCEPLGIGHFKLTINEKWSK